MLLILASFMAGRRYDCCLHKRSGYCFCAFYFSDPILLKKDAFMLVPTTSVNICQEQYQIDLF